MTLNGKLDQWKDTFRCALLLKNISRKRSQKQNKRKSKKRKQRERKHFKLLHQLLSADLNSDVIEISCTPSVRQVRWLTKMAKNGHFTERAITIAQDYLEGFMDESKEDLNTDESLSGEDSDSLTKNEECGD